MSMKYFKWMETRSWNESKILLQTSSESKNFEKGMEDNLSAPSWFIANAHNEIYALIYTEKAAFWKNMSL